VVPFFTVRWQSWQGLILFLAIFIYRRQARIYQKEIVHSVPIGKPHCYDGTPHDLTTTPKRIKYVTAHSAIKLLFDFNSDLLHCSTFAIGSRFTDSGPAKIASTHQVCARI